MKNQNSVSRPTPSALSILLSAGLLLSAPAFAKSYPVSPAQSQIRWTGKKVTGEHSGTVALKSGQIELDGKTFKGGRFEIDMRSIANEDIKDAENNAKLVGHLKSDDFFGTEKNPSAIFKITSVKPLKAATKDASHEIAGDLTIKGQTHPVTFPAKVEVKDGNAQARGKITVDRTKYNIRYGSGKFFENLGDKMIDDTFTIDLDVKTKI